MMKKVGIIGAGVFGCSAALELAKDFDVTVFDRANNILEGASTINHLRHHYGFHYPRLRAGTSSCCPADEPAWSVPLNPGAWERGQSGSPDTLLAESSSAPAGGPAAERGLIPRTSRSCRGADDFPSCRHGPK